MKSTIYKEVLKSNYISSIIKIVIISTLAGSLVSCNKSETRHGWNNTFSNSGSSDVVKDDSSTSNGSSSSSSGSSGNGSSSGSSSGSSGTCTANAQTCVYSSNLAAPVYTRLRSECQADAVWDDNVNSCADRVGGSRTHICTQDLGVGTLASYVFELSTQQAVDVAASCESFQGGSSQILNN